MKGSALITLLSLTSTAVAAPRNPHVLRQLPEDPNAGLTVTLPVPLSNTGNAKIDGIVNTINEWRGHITAINDFIDATTRQLAAPLASQDSSVILNGLQGLNDHANQEPVLLAKLISLTDITQLTEETTNSMNTLKRELVNANAVGIFNAIESRAKFTPVAKTEQELAGFQEQDKKLQPFCTVGDQMVQLRGTRCCSVLQFTNTIWRNVVFNEGLGTLVNPDVPMPSVCDKNACFLNQKRCGPPELVEGYEFVTQSPSGIQGVP